MSPGGGGEGATSPTWQAAPTRNTRGTANTNNILYTKASYSMTTDGIWKVSQPQHTRRAQHLNPENDFETCLNECASPVGIPHLASLIQRNMLIYNTCDVYMAFQIPERERR